MSNQYGPRIVTNGLVLCLDAGNNKSYPGSGTVWNDLSGNNFNGILTNGPTYSPSSGGGIVFDGVNDYISLGSVLNNSFTGLSFSFFCYYSGYTTFPRIVAKNHDTWTVYLRYSTKSCLFLDDNFHLASIQALSSNTDLKAMERKLVSTFIILNIFF